MRPRGEVLLGTLPQPVSRQPDVTGLSRTDLLDRCLGGGAAAGQFGESTNRQPGRRAASALVGGKKGSGYSMAFLISLQIWTHALSRSAFICASGLSRGMTA